MGNSKLIKKLSKLAQIDIDTVEAYEQAIKRIDNTYIKNNLCRFRDDHKHHIQELNRLIVSLGGNAVNESIDLKGLLLEGLTVLRSISGIEGALKAMKGNENLTNRTYDAVIALNELPEKVQLLLMKNRNDDRRHVAYIDQLLTDEPWK